MQTTFVGSLLRRNSRAKKLLKFEVLTYRANMGNELYEHVAVCHLGLGMRLILNLDLTVNCSWNVNSVC